MKIVQVNTFDIVGGAAKAAYRLHGGLRSADAGSSMLVKCKRSQDPTVQQLHAEAVSEGIRRAFLFGDIVQEHYINAHRSSLSNTLFSYPYPGYDLTRESLIREADIVNLHWVAQYQSPVSLAALFALGKPVVWTLHDQWAFTGGCHYTANCSKYAERCSQCPQLLEDPAGLPATVLEDKKKLFAGAPLTIVTPSKWLATCAKTSQLFKGSRIEVIPNSIDTDVYCPTDKVAARSQLGIAGEGRIILFGCENAEERRKGFPELLAAMRHCISSPDYGRFAGNHRLRVLCFGQPAAELRDAGLDLISLGYLDDERRIRDAYCAADLLVLPSLEDNLPNMMLESMSCGTPVVAFDTGGMPDAITSGLTGILVPCGDTRALGDAVLGLLSNTDILTRMGGDGRAYAVKCYATRVQANNYLRLYEALLDEAPRKKRPSLGTEARPSGPGDLNQRTRLGPDTEGIDSRVLLSALLDFAPVATARLTQETALLKKERELAASLQEEILPLRAFARRVKWLYELYLHLASLATAARKSNGRGNHANEAT